jgi:predicted GNAT family acetyltransferase
MRLERFGDIEAFAARVAPYLLAHEATHCLPLGLLATLPGEPLPGGEAPYMALVEDAGGTVILVALRTPPFGLILSLLASDVAADPNATNEALALVADDVSDRYAGGLPGVNGPVPVARLFADLWQRRMGGATRLVVHERVYQLETVIPASAYGAMRPVTEGDRDLLTRWMAEFAAEALPEQGIDAAAWVDHYLASPSRGGYLWEDGVPVTWVGYGNPTARGIRIGPGYTPPEQRGHGYASACVAVTSQRLLESGRMFCFLFADLANPTANHIYQTVGYTPVNDVDVYEFEME